MSPSDSQTQNGKRSRETSEVFDPVFDFLMDFADKAEAIVPLPKRRATVPVDEEEPLENRSDGNTGEMFDKLPVKDKEELLKDVFGEIVGNILDNLPEDGKEEFLARCFDGLFPKLPCESQRVIEIKVREASSQSLEALPTQSAPELPLAIPNQFPTDDLRPVLFNVEYPPGIRIRPGGQGQGHGEGRGGGQGRGHGEGRGGEQGRGHGQGQGHGEGRGGGRGRGH